MFVVFVLEGIVFDRLCLARMSGHDPVTLCQVRTDMRKRHRLTVVPRRRPSGEDFHLLRRVTLAVRPPDGGRLRNGRPKKIDPL